jgi:hypothetical protein
MQGRLEGHTVRETVTLVVVKAAARAKMDMEKKMG